MRFLTLFLAAMFIASNAAAAVRACVADLAGQGHTAVRVLAAAGEEELCPQFGDAGPCPLHYAQGHQNYEQEFWADFTPAAPAPVLALLKGSFQAQPKLLVAASAPSIIGPSLTILYRNFRN